MNDLVSIQNTGALPPGVSLQGGNALFLSGPVSKGLNFSNAGSFGLNTFGDGTATYAISGDTLTITFTNTAVGTVTQVYQRS